MIPIGEQTTRISEAKDAAPAEPPAPAPQPRLEQAKKSTEALAADMIEEGKQAARHLVEEVKKPLTGAAIAGTVAIAAAVIWGAAEAAVGAGAAILVYRLLRKRPRRYETTDRAERN